MPWIHSHLPAIALSVFAGALGGHSALAASDPGDQFLNDPASETGSHVYQEVTLQTETAWPNIDNIVVNGGRAISAQGKTIRNSTVGPVNISGAYSALYMNDKTKIRDLEVSNFKVTEAQREGIRFKGDVDGVHIHNFSIRMRSEPQTGGHLPEGIAVYTGQNIVIEDGYISGFQMEKIPGKYQNGDGISAERPVNHLTIRRVTANDNGDAGFDLKSDNTILDDTHAARNYRNYRVWTKAKAGTIYSTDPRQAHVWVGSGAEVYIDKLVAKSDTRVYVVLAKPDAKRIVIKSCDLDVPNAKQFFSGSSSTQLRLGPGCSLPK